MAGYNFGKMFMDKGFIVKDEAGAPVLDENGDQQLDVAKAAEALNVRKGDLTKVIEGWGNPLSGKTFYGLIDFLGIPEPNLRAFLRWRQDKWTKWDEHGCLAEGDEGYNPTIDMWDDETDYNNEYLEEETANFAAANAEEVETSEETDIESESEETESAPTTDDDL